MYGMKTRGFPGDVGSDVPGIRGREKSIARKLVDVRNPGVLRVRTSLDVAESTFARVA
jgi:hypothetical protein